MKRTDIKPGTRYLVSNARDWQDMNYGEQVEILDTGDWDIHGGYKTPEDRDVTLPSGKVLPAVNGAYVDRKPWHGPSYLLGWHVSRARYTLVKASEVKAPYAEGRSIQEANQRVRNEAIQRERSRDQAEQDRAEALAAQFESKFGFQVRAYASYGGQRKFSLTLDQMETLLGH